MSTIGEDGDLCEEIETENAVEKQVHILPYFCLASSSTMCGGSGTITTWAALPSFRRSAESSMRASRHAYRSTSDPSSHRSRAHERMYTEALQNLRDAYFL